ncbi:MAG: tyrosine-type recombinase/integrase [Methylobacterium sp.]|nr:tyrosine-type recombinase/integrase [Methylobacterium sp.]MCA3654187.1 tyrosine-type recombinase/integrase [Methylobacterium sp.]MCA3657016.1 tyrosine-type recombinase/integrase [Methylobacterium sp.]MCA3661081.1 tyrosine-type recombinase/integrase [Methylobacterium sp.]MCA3664804.1 tyrosine-type recombinase/integrase [Methylobacterium sp.]
MAISGDSDPKFIAPDPADDESVSALVVSARPELSAETTWPVPSRLAATARDYAAARSSSNTRKAYQSDWALFARWCRRRGFDAREPSPEVVGLFLAASAAGEGLVKAAVSTIERRLAAITTTCSSAGTPLPRQDRHITDVMAGIRRRHARPPRQKEALLAEDILAMIATLPNDLRGLRDRAILLVGFAGGLRRSEITGLDCGPDQTTDSGGWIEIVKDGALLGIRGKTGWRQVEIGRGSSERSCPVHALETWLKLGRVAHGPVFRRMATKNGGISPDRLGDKHVARLVKQTALKAGIRSDLPEKERAALFGGHSLRAGLASSAGIDEAHVQRQLGHASAEMTRRYQRRRERFRVNLTRAAGL